MVSYPSLQLSRVLYWTLRLSGERSLNICTILKYYFHIKTLLDCNIKYSTWNCFVCSQNHANYRIQIQYNTIKFLSVWKTLARLCTFHEEMYLLRKQLWWAQVNTAIVIIFIIYVWWFSTTVSTCSLNLLWQMESIRIFFLFIYNSLNALPWL